MRNISLVVILFVYVSCTNEVVDTHTGSGFDNTDDSSYITDGSNSDTPTDKLDSTSETEKTTDTGEPGHTDTEPTDTDGDTTTQTRTPGHGDTSQDSLSDTESSRPTDGDTGADTESATVGTDTGSEEDTALDTTPQDTETEVTCVCDSTDMFRSKCREYCREYLYPCYPEFGYFVPEQCCNCVSDPPAYELYCGEYCIAQKDTDSIDTDTGPEPNHECNLSDHERCSPDGDHIQACQEVYNSQLGIYENKWVDIDECGELYSCYYDNLGYADCERDKLGEPLGKCQVTEYWHKHCIAGHDIWWIIQCVEGQWVLSDTCTYGCEIVEESWPVDFVCGEDL